MRHDAELLLSLFCIIYAHLRISLKLVPWCEVFVNEDAVFCRASFIEDYAYLIMSLKLVISQIVLRLSLITILPLAVPQSLIGLFKFSSFERKFRTPWCEVFVDEDAVFGGASFVEVFETAPGTIHRVSTALAVEANNGGSRLCLAVDWVFRIGGIVPGHCVRLAELRAFCCLQFQ